MLRVYDVDGKLLNEIKSMYVNSLACIKVKGNKSNCFRIENVVGQSCIMSSCLFNVYVGAVMKEVKMGMGRITWPLVLRRLGFVWAVKGRPEKDGGAFC